MTIKIEKEVKEWNQLDITDENDELILSLVRDNDEFVVKDGYKVIVDGFDCTETVNLINSKEIK